ncbi:MAG TPA: hypothetical protein VJY54_06775 [Lachnospiraceae bacterium]|nr:hypothetical protein [Lachnospiraceae bacterium]
MVYLDYNATTPIDKEVAEARLPFLSMVISETLPAPIVWASLPKQL